MEEAKGGDSAIHYKFSQKVVAEVKGLDQKDSDIWVENTETGC